MKLCFLNQPEDTGNQCAAGIKQDQHLTLILGNGKSDVTLLTVVFRCASQCMQVRRSVFIDHVELIVNHIEQTDYH